MKTNYPKTLAVAVGVTAFVAFFATFASLAHAAQNDGGDVGMGFVTIGIILFAYFFPTVVANVRKHNHIMAIFCVNLFLGWTFIGWVVALVWACMNTVRSRVTA